MKKIYWTIVIVVLILVVVLVLKSNDNFGIVKKGDDVRENIVNERSSSVLCALDLYRQADSEGMNFSSQCLGVCGDFVVDVVHAPRNEIDDLIENQCGDYNSGEIIRFIELNQEGELVRIE